ncbi:MAG: ABC transporter ATP-binding protein [Clostridia bacterium]|jgi:multidrug/hemolysin transport system ATP-binding protein|nr:ABC transporter ATP-binding protein [Clostridia bacterium]
MNIIEIKDLHKSFGEIKAVDGISFKVNEGELFAFLGQNGAGKSTTISIICGRLLKDNGEVFVNGQNIDEKTVAIKRDIGVVFQSSVLDKQLSVYENLKSRAALYGIFGDELKTRIDELDGLLDFKPLLKRTVGKLSGGQRRKIDIARALIHKPKILILDEPTTGLDPQTRSSVWSVVRTLQRNEKMTVFLTTHYMEEAADADNVIIIDQGRIVAEGTPHELKNRYTGDFITLYGVDEQDVQKLGCPYRKEKDSFIVTVKNTALATELIVKHKEIFNDYEITKGDMDDVFLSVTGKELGGDEK